MLTAQQRQVLKVAARWSLQQIPAEWLPPLPKRLLARLAYLPSTPDFQALNDARDSVSVFMPKLLQTLRTVQGDPYYMNASESRGRIFYFFAPKHPIDSFNLALWIQGGKAHLSFGYLPQKLDGQLDFKKGISERAAVEPEMAGLALMRLLRSVLSTKARLKFGSQL